MNKKLGLIGVGQMGEAIATRLLSQGFDVTVYNRSPGKTEYVKSIGAGVAMSPCQLVRTNSLVISTLTDENAVKAVCEGPDGLFAQGSDCVHLSLSTLSPEASERLSKLHGAAGMHFISAPVQGRPQMARSGNLVAWVSGGMIGSKEQSVLDAIAHKTIYLGTDPKTSAAAKLSLNMLMNANIVLFAEALAYAEQYGLSPTTFGDGLTETVFKAPIFKGVVASILSNNSDASGSNVNISHKDSSLLVNGPYGKQLPISTAVDEVFAAAHAQGLGDLDPTAVKFLFKPLSNLLTPNNSKEP